MNFQEEMVAMFLAFDDNKSLFSLDKEARQAYIMKARRLISFLEAKNHHIGKINVG